MLRLLAALPLAAGTVALLTVLAAAPPGVRRFGPGAEPASWTALGPAEVRLRLKPVDGPPLPAAAWADAGLGLRQDVFTLGTFAAGDAPFLRVAVTTPLTEGGRLPAPDDSADSALGRRAAEADGLALTRIIRRDRLPTRFGALDLLDVVLSGGPPRPCTAFRLRRAPAEVLAIEGYVCGPGGSLPEPASLAGLLERLTLEGPVPADVVARFEAGAGGSAETTASTRSAGARPHTVPAGR